MSRVTTSSSSTVSRVRESRGPKPLSGATLHDDDHHDPFEKPKPGRDTDEDRSYQTEPAVTVDVGSGSEASIAGGQYPDAAMSKARLDSDSDHSQLDHLAQLDHLVQNHSLQPGPIAALDPSGSLAEQLGDLNSEEIEPEPGPQSKKAYAPLSHAAHKKSSARIFALLEDLSLARQSGGAIPDRDRENAGLAGTGPDFALAYGAVLLAIATGNPRFMLPISAASNAADYIPPHIFEPLRDEITELSLNFFGDETGWQQLPIPLLMGEGIQLFLEWEKSDCRAAPPGEQSGTREKSNTRQNHFTLILATPVRPDLRLQILATEERFDTRFSGGHSISIRDQQKIKSGFNGFLAAMSLQGKIYFDGPRT